MVTWKARTLILHCHGLEAVVIRNKDVLDGLKGVYYFSRRLR